MVFGPLKSTPLVDAKRYRVRLAGYWLYSAAWAGLALVAFYWDGVSLPIRIALWLLLIFGTPALSDLFQSYAKYRVRWERENPATQGGRVEESP